MHDRKSTLRWMVVILCVGILSLSLPMAGGSRPVPAVPQPPGSDQSVTAVSGEPTFLTKTFPRSVAWWPYSSGPFYGNVPYRPDSDTDVIYTPVGSFRTGQALAIPAELRGSLDKVAAGGKQYFLAQLRPSGVVPEWRQILASLGAEIMEENPVNSMVLRMNRATYDQVAASPFIHYIEPYHPAYRIHPSVGHMPQATAQEAASPLFSLQLLLFAGESATATAELVKALGATVTQVFDSPDGGQSWLKCVTHAGLIPQMARIESVLMITENTVNKLNGSRGSLYLQSETALRGDFPFWKAGVDGGGTDLDGDGVFETGELFPQIVHVTDTGMSVDAGDFSHTRASSGYASDGTGGLCATLTPTFHRKVACYRTTNAWGGAGDYKACDSFGNGAFSHGQVCSHIAVGGATRGVVPAPLSPSPTDNRPNFPAFGAGFYDDRNLDNKFEEVYDFGFDGIAKGARLVFADGTVGGCPEAVMDPGISPGDLRLSIQDTWTQHRASIHSFSFGSVNPSGGPIYSGNGSLIDNAILNYPINFHAQAAGNSGPITDGFGHSNIDGNVDNQASCKNCVVVGSSSGVGGAIANYTSEGPAYTDSVNPTKSRIAPLLLAEGYENACRSEDGSETPNENQTGAATCLDTGFSQGTSFATPNVAGAAAMIRDYFAKGFYPDGTDRNTNNAGEREPAISNRLIKAVMIAGAKPIAAGKADLPADRFNNVWGYGQIFLTRSLPLSDYPQTVSGLIVHDVPGVDLDGDGTIDSITSTSLPGTINYNQTLNEDFRVLDANKDLSVALVWDDAAGTTGALTYDLDLEVTYCGADGTCGNSDDIVYPGNAFGEDYNRDGTSDIELVNPSTVDGYWYSISKALITSKGGNPANWADKGNNTEAVFIPNSLNAQDLNEDGTVDNPTLVTKAGLWRVTIKGISTNVSNLPFALAIAGPVAAGSSVRFDSNPVSCNGDEAVIVNEREDAADPLCDTQAGCTIAEVKSRVVIQVRDTNGSLYDQINGSDLPDNYWTKTAGTLNFETTKRLPLSSTMDPDLGDTILTVRNGYTLEVAYNDQKGATVEARRSVAQVDCQPQVGVLLIEQLGRDTFFALGGGCDDDRYLDEGESFQMTFRFYNTDRLPLADAQVGLRAVDPDTCTATDRCRTGCPNVPYVKIDQPAQNIGTLNANFYQDSTFVFKVEGAPSAGRKRVEFLFSLKSDKSGQSEADCYAFSKLEALEMLVQADDKVNRYITDCPTGCTMDNDENGDEIYENRIARNDFDMSGFARVGVDETAIVFGDLTDISFRTVDGDGDGTLECPNCGNPGFNGPWNFDDNRELFTVGLAPRSELTPTTTDGISNWGEDHDYDNTLDSGENQPDGSPSTLDLNWRKTGGGCGWMTKNTADAAGGIWHTGTIGTGGTALGAPACRTGSSADEAKCETFDTEKGTTGQAFWMEYLRTAQVHPVRQGTDTDGFEWKSQILDWSWNMQADIPSDGWSLWTWEWDVNVEDQRLQLGDLVIAGGLFGGGMGLVNGDSNSYYGGAPSFAPTDEDPDNTGTPGYGDQKNGTLGGNRAGRRGCYFQDLETIDLDGSGPGVATAAWHPRNDPKPFDDDCDNNYSLGPNGCPGTCGVDDDGNGFVDDIYEICPCRRCETGSPKVGQACVNNQFCNVANDTLYECAPNTNASGVPAGFGDDVCGNGQTDEGVNSVFAWINPSAPWGNRQRRNSGIWISNGVGDAGFPNGNPRYNTLEDFWGPAGSTWQGEIGFYVNEPSGTEAAIKSYGMGIDDMVVEWQESHPVPQKRCSNDTGKVCTDNGDCPGGTCLATNTCSASVTGFEGQCAQLSLGNLYTLDGDGQVPVSLIDPYPSGNLVDCDGDGTSKEVQVLGYSRAEPAGENYCLQPVAGSSTQFAGTIRTTTRILGAGDDMVYCAYDPLGSPFVSVRYIDKYDGLHTVSVGADGQPGVAGVDDNGDGTVDNAAELCPTTTQLARGRSPHAPGKAARWSDDQCGCLDNPVENAIAVAFSVVDVGIRKSQIRDGIGGVGKGDGDGWADPNETVQVDLVVKNFSDVPLTNVVLTLASPSPLVGCLVNDKVTIPTLPARGEVNTATLGEHFKFIVAPPGAGNQRTSINQDFSSTWTLGLTALAKPEPGSGTDLRLDIPLWGTSSLQQVKIVHNLDAPSTTSAPEFFDNFEGYSFDKDYDGTATRFRCNTNTRCVLDYYEPRWTGDDLEELTGTRCQLNNPSNPYGANTQPEFFCQLGEGFDNSEQHWHLHATTTTSTNTGVCENQNCPTGARSVDLDQNGTSQGTYNKCLSNSNLKQGGGALGDGFTIDLNRMNWVETRFDRDNDGTFRESGENLQLGTGSPELQYWTQLSITDGRSLSIPGWYSFDTEMTYICVDRNNNGWCDTRETYQNTSTRGTENWEVLHAYFSPETGFRLNNLINCAYEPSDDGNTEDSLFPNELRAGPSSTCFPNRVDSCVGRTREGGPSDQPAVVLVSQCWPETGLEGDEIANPSVSVNERARKGNGEGTWVLRKYDLAVWKGQKVLFRWHHAPQALPGSDNLAGGAGIFFGNRDDGWFIDNVRVTGLAQPFAISNDNTGDTTHESCGDSCTSINVDVLVIPYPRNDRNGAPKPAIACTNPACDNNLDGTADVTSTPNGSSDAPGRAFVIDARFTSANSCLGGTLEYRTLAGAAVLRDWSTNYEVIINPVVDTTYTFQSRCSTEPACIGSADFTIDVPDVATACTVDPLSLVVDADLQTINWSGTGGAFDTAKGVLGDLLSTASFADAACLDPSGADTTSSDPATPNAGEAFYYLVRCHSGDWGTWSDGTPRDVTTCP